MNIYKTKYIWSDKTKKKQKNIAKQRFVCAKLTNAHINCQANCDFISKRPMKFVKSLYNPPRNKQQQQRTH